MSKDPKNVHLTSLQQFIERQYGKTGTPKRDKFEAGYEQFKRDFLLNIPGRHRLGHVKNT